MKKYNFILLVTITFALSGMKRIHEEEKIPFFDLLPREVRKKIIYYFVKEQPMRFVIIERVCRAWYDDFIPTDQEILLLCFNAQKENQKFLENYNAFIEGVYDYDEEEEFLYDFVDTRLFEISYSLPDKENLLSLSMYNFDLPLLEKLINKKDEFFDKVFVRDDAKFTFFNKIINEEYNRLPLFKAMLPIFKVNEQLNVTHYFECIMQRACTILNEEFIRDEDIRLYNYTSTLVSANADCSFFRTEAGATQVQQLNQEDFPKLKGLCEQLTRSNVG
jgi:hypothetical protein